MSASVYTLGDYIAAMAVAAPISAAGTATRTTRFATTRGAAPCPVSAKRAPNHMSTGNIATTARTPAEAAGNATAASGVSGAGQQPLTPRSADESTCSPPNRLSAKYATSQQPIATATRRRRSLHLRGDDRRLVAYDRSRERTTSCRWRGRSLRLPRARPAPKRAAGQAGASPRHPRESRGASEAGPARA